MNSDPRPEAENGAAEPRTTTRAPRDAGDLARSDDAPAAPGGIRCVAALAPGGLVPDALARAMHKRGVPVAWRRGAYEALLEVVRNPSGVALVIVEPPAFPNDQPSRLARAASRHAPDLVVWRYDAAETERSSLRPYAPAASPSRAAERPAEPEPAVVVTPPAAFEPAAFESGPRLRLAGLHETPAGGEPDEREAEGPRAQNEADPPASPSELLTSEELTMLLGDGDAPDARGGSHG